MSQTIYSKAFRDILGQIEDNPELYCNMQAPTGVASILLNVLSNVWPHYADQPMCFPLRADGVVDLFCLLVDEDLPEGMDLSDPLAFEDLRRFADMMKETRASWDVRRRMEVA